MRACLCVCVHVCTRETGGSLHGGILPDSLSCPHFNWEGLSEPTYFFPATEPMPLPQQGLQAEAKRGREGGKKREKPRFLREGGEERKRRKTSSEIEKVKET